MARLRKLQQEMIDILGAHPEGIDISGIRKALKLEEGDNQEQLGRRLRELDDYFEIKRIKSGAKTFYILIGERETKRQRSAVSKTLRADVLWRAQGRCQMCGRDVKDGAELHVDHKMPESWGGPTRIDNLWALCSTCNEGKKNFFATITDERIQHSMLHSSVHIRLGEMLKAFEGDSIPSQYLELVAYTHDDWQKRLRELREIGWDYQVTKRKDPDSGRVSVSYSLVQSAPWPDDPAAAIRDAERRKKTKR